MESSITEEDKYRIIDHMNADHADACLLYVQHYGGRTDALAAVLVDVQEHQMLLDAELSDGNREQIVVPFAAPVRSSEDAHQTLVAMVQAARISSIWSDQEREG
ncbi:MAG: heme iron utilization protein [Alphaproteobacteria bacterium]|nr:heme iron utilization protein [Alphaproteobacteria bacterium]